MKKVKTVVVALVLAVIMAMPVTVTASAFVDVESTVAVDEDSAYAPLRLVAYAYGAAVEWDSANREAVITRADGYVILIPVEAVGGFIENGVAWVPMDFVYDVLVGLLTIETAPARVERIDLTLWNAENFEDTRDPMFSTDEPMGVIATGFIEYMSDNLGARSAFTYRELEAAVWIVEELLAMGHDWDNIAIQEFTYWQVHDMGLQTFGSLNWDNVTSPWILGVDRDYQIRADRVSQNVVLTLPGQSERMIIVGAHYDSPPYPSASDNASGTALLMESAQRMLELEHYYTIVYVFFGAEEVGLVGAYYYLESLTARERDNILMMVNADVIIEGPYIIYGAGSVPVLDDAKLASLVEAIMADEGILDFLLMQYQMIRAELTEMGIEDMGSQFPFDSFESLVEFQAAIFAASPTDLLMQAYMLGLVEPYIDDVAQQVTDIAAQLTSQHDFELISIPDVIGFSSDQLAFLFGGHTVVNFVGLERLDNIDAELAAQLFAVMDIFDGFSATVLHTVLDNFQFIEATWPGMINANLEAFMILLEAILTGSFS